MQLLHTLNSVLQERRAPKLARLDALRAVTAIDSDRGEPQTLLGRRNRESAAEFGWDFEMLAFSPWIPAPHHFDDDEGFRALQRGLQVEDDGWFGATSYAALMRKYQTKLIVAGKPYDPPPGMVVRNWHRGDGTVKRFAGKSRRGRPVDMLVAHEAVDDSMVDTQRTLIRRGLGVHLMITPKREDGVCIVTQHGDLLWDRFAHAGGQNGPSIAAEYVSPYYPEHTPKDYPDGRVLSPVGWAHDGSNNVKDYRMMPLWMLEAGWKLIEWLTDSDGPVAIPRQWIGWDESRDRFALSRVPGNPRRPGIWAHTYTAHADAAVPVLYAWLRAHRIAPEEAYDKVHVLADTEGRYASVGLLGL